ncbi:ribosome small subunit-dependent GTPase A [Anaerocolumna cellulosilytica]|uniref:ribosome small subunit-dependent GTPase A n=1 Tax=Anaerocolumna cellulosilytica TaxID=433286 RepID=UPI00183A4C89|nr:ribosome small subunit-dependent GTPase A [Anaerocolumna cellulosilytica]MBB5194985.1 ribosome biogenesis GTPase [Anaerocolumna cellulosilytica]
MPRKSQFSRKMPISGGRKIKKGVIQGGSTEEQVMASNIDIAFIVCGLDNNFDLRRIERYITLVYNSRVKPVVILNKADKCPNPEDFLRLVEEVAIKIPVYIVSALKSISMDVFTQYMQPGKTVVFLGSSGVGKSTIINCLFGENRQQTKLISESTGKGRHTTTYSELIMHDSGCMLIDTPGSRELQLWGTTDCLDESFQDIIELSYKCKYNDCQHHNEPGCAIIKAIEEGSLSYERYESYKKQFFELKLLDKRKKQLELYRNKMMKRNKF